MEKVKVAHPIADKLIQSDEVFKQNSFILKKFTKAFPVFSHSKSKGLGLSPAGTPS